MARLTIELVKHAINELKAQGKKPTNQNIIDFIGYGSFSTLANFRKLYPTVFVSILNTVNDTVQDTLFNTVNENLVNAFWERLEPRVKNCIKSVSEQPINTVDTQSNTLDTDSNTDIAELQASIARERVYFEQLEKDNCEFQNIITNLKLENDNIRFNKEDLIECEDDLGAMHELWLDAVESSKTYTHHKALTKLVFLVTSGAIKTMLQNSEVGYMIGMSGKDVGRLRTEGKKQLERESKSKVIIATT